MVRAMFRYAFQVSIALLLGCICVTSSAHAEPLPHDATLQLGRPLHPVRVTLTTGADLTLVAAGKRRVLPAKNATDATIELAAVATDAAVAIVRVSTPTGRWVGLLGGRSGSDLLLFERADPTGDPGEQRAREVASGGEPSSVRTGVRFEGVSLCAERPAWFDAQRVDPTTLLLVADPTPAAPTKLEDAPVSVAPTPPVRPVLSLLAPVASSERDEGTALPRVPRTLVDEDAARGLALEPGGFVQLRWEGGALPIQRLELELTSAVEKKVELLLFDEHEAVVRATLPASRGPQRFVIAPARPLSGRCLALRVTDASGVELRELYAYTELDQAGGVDRLIAALVQDSEGSSAAVDLLEKLGPQAADRLATRWPELSARGQRRGLKVLARALPLATVRQRVLETAQSPDAELRERAVVVLERGGEPGRVGLRQLSLVAGESGDLALRALAAHPEELPALLAALGSEGGSERPALRKALVQVARKDPAAARAAASSWLATTPGMPARAALALSFAEAGDHDFTASLADAEAPAAQAFAERYRYALALAGATATPAGDAWLAQQSEQAEEWMQRRVALAALVARGSAAAPALADKAARDPYPRVRAGALAPLVAAGQPAQVEALLVHDAWPLVRAEAAHALAAQPTSGPALEQAVDDRSRLVRRAAIDALTHGKRVQAWPRVRARLAVKGESLEVRESAIEFARRLCLPEAREVLVPVAKKLQSPDASEEDNQVAVEALRALHDLGGEAQKAGAAVVAEEGAPELLKLWQRLPPAQCAAVPAS
jgi:hypothetical protein